MDSIHSVVQQLEEDYMDGKPPHAIEGAISVFHILTQEVYNKKSVREIQETLCTQHIVIIDQQQSCAKFDTHGLQMLTRLNEPVSIQGVSLVVFHSGSL